MMISHLLTWILLLPAIGALCLVFVPENNTRLIRQMAIAFVLVAAVLSGMAFMNYDHALGGYQFVEKMSWVPTMGISYHVGIDGINALLILLVAFASLSATLVSSRITHRIKEYYILLLVTLFGTYAAFLSLDIFFFYFAHEIAAIPVFLMISIWGSDKKEYGAMKLTLYLTAGASVALIGLIGLFFATGLFTFDLVQIQQHLATHPIPLSIQNWIFPLIVLGFGVTLTLWPFHTWAPVGYTTAPTAISMMHAGVLKKMGAYAIIRFAIQLMPEAAQIWMPIVAILAVVNILFCGFVALTQRDIKYLLGYSSCSHMGYILLGLACANTIGLTGVVFLMFAHGILASLGFALEGYIYDQTRTRKIEELGGLLKCMPFVSTCFIMMAFASAGVPGFANFVAEILVLLGAFDQYRILTIGAILGIVITAIYMLKVVRLGFQGPLPERLAKLKDAQTPLEKLPFVLLIVVLLIVGCFPSSIMKHINSATRQFFSATK